MSADYYKWTVSNGDFCHSEDSDYEKKFKLAKRAKKVFITKISIILGLTALGAAIMIFETILRA